MKTNRKERIVEDLSKLIAKAVREAKVAHRYYLKAIREKNLPSELKEYHEREILLDSARDMKAALLADSEKVHWGGNLFRVRKRRLAAMQTASEPSDAEKVEKDMVITMQNWNVLLESALGRGALEEAAPCSN